MPTQIGSRQLRSSSAHCARKLAKSLGKSWQGGSGLEVAEVDLEVDAEVVEEKEEKEKNNSDKI